MNCKRLFGLILSLAFSSTLLAGPAEDFKRGFKAYVSDQDVMTAMQYLEPAAAQGHVRAQVLLAYILDKSGLNEQAVDWYRKAADSGDAAGEYGLALMLAAGEGVEPDEKKAVDLINSAAVKGHAPAMIWLAGAYATGSYGLEKDPAKSAEWEKKTAQAKKPKQ